jgi:hypothetical protein
VIEDVLQGYNATIFACVVSGAFWGGFIYKCTIFFGFLGRKTGLERNLSPKNTKNERKWTKNDAFWEGTFDFFALIL